MSDKKPMSVEEIQEQLRKDVASLPFYGTVNFGIEKLIAAARHSERAAILAEFKVLADGWISMGTTPLDKTDVCDCDQCYYTRELGKELTALIQTIESRKP